VTRSGLTPAPEFAALLATARAERTRLPDRTPAAAAAAAAAWEAAVAAWDRLGDPHRAGVARARLAAALLAERGGDQRGRAAAALRTAAEVARELGAAPLAQEAARVARRGGVDLDGGGAGGAAHGLTPREVEVLRLVAAGRSNREIGTALWISAKTASVHVSNILGKLDVRSRGEAAAVAHREGLLQDGY